MASATGGRSGAAAEGAPSVHCTSQAFPCGATGTAPCVPAQCPSCAIATARAADAGPVRQHARVRRHRDMGEGECPGCRSRRRGGGAGGSWGQSNVTGIVTPARLGGLDRCQGGRRWPPPLPCFSAPEACRAPCRAPRSGSGRVRAIRRRAPRQWPRARGQARRRTGSSCRPKRRPQAHRRPPRSRPC